MDVIRRVVSHALEVIALQDAQREKFSRTLTRGRILVHNITTIVVRGRLLHFGSVGGEILVAHQTAVFLGESRHLAAIVFFVNAFARLFASCLTPLAGSLPFRLNQTAERARQVEVLENLTFPPLLTLRLVNFPAGWILR